MKVKKNREWALEFTALPMIIALDANGFGRSQSQQLIISDPEGGVGLSPFWVNRFIGTASVIAGPREVDGPSRGFWGVMALGLLRSNNTGSESFNLTDIDILADEDVDQPWLFRTFTSLWIWNTAAPGPNIPAVFVPVVVDHAINQNITLTSGGAGPGVANPTEYFSSRGIPIDWAIRGGKGTRLEHDAGVSLHVALVSYLPTTSNPHLTGEDYQVDVGVAGTFLFTTT